MTHIFAPVSLFKVVLIFFRTKLKSDQGPIMKRVYPSGHEKRKKIESQARRVAATLSQTRQITTFLTKVTKHKADDSETAAQCSTSSSADNDVEVVQMEDRLDTDIEPQIDSNIGMKTDIEMPVVDDSVGHMENASLLDPGLTNDIGLWPYPATDTMREYWVRKGNVVHKTQEIMRADGFGKSTNRNRQCTADMFLRKSGNGETLERKWLCYSKSTGRIYCFECKLFNSSPIVLASNGFNDWTHAGERLSEHEKSKGHACAICTFAQRADVVGRVDSDLEKQIDELTTYWVKVLNRLVSVITVLAERGLAFRGDNQTVGSPHNGNYLALLELIADYDTFLAQHIKLHANKGAGHTNYLSSIICEELLDIMGQKVLTDLVDRVKSAKYYSITVDSSEDYAHIDQLTVVLRYMEGAEPVERFFTFLPSTGHKGIDMAKAVQSYLKDIGINILDCRGQSYDNASNMSGKYQGMQSRLLEINPCATFIPCFGHSLNLVGTEAASSCSEAVSFFDLVQALYVLFTSSTSRHKKLHDVLQEKNTVVSMPKKLSDTRWSCRADAVQALTKGYEDIMDLLLDMLEDDNEKADCRCTARGLHDRMARLETGIFAEFWKVLLERFNKSSKTLQSTKLNLNAASDVLKSLLEFVKEQRDRFNYFEEAGSLLSGTNVYTTQTKRKRRRNTRLDPLDYGQSTEADMSPKDEFRTKALFPCIDSLVACIEKRLLAYRDVADRFGFFIYLPNMNQTSVTEAATKLLSFYKDDLDDSFPYELLHFQHFVSVFLDQKEDSVSLEWFMYNLILEKDVAATFPNTTTALKIYLTLMITNCSGERSFSKMKLIKNLNRTTMGQMRFCNLVRMSMESDILRKLDFKDIIHAFACKKARKVSI